jgi:hypothetical protein
VISYCLTGWLVAGQAGYQIDGAKVGWQLRSSGDYPVMCSSMIQHESYNKTIVLFIVSRSLRRLAIEIAAERGSESRDVTIAFPGKNKNDRSISSVKTQF